MNIIKFNSYQSEIIFTLKKNEILKYTILQDEQKTHNYNGKLI